MSSSIHGDKSNLSMDRIKWAVVSFLAGGIVALFLLWLGNDGNSELQGVKGYMSVFIGVFVSVSCYIMGELYLGHREVIGEISELEEIIKNEEQIKIVIGHSNVFRELADMVKNAKDSIWAARFSKSIAPHDEDEKEYLELTKNKIRNDRGGVVQYRLLANLNAPDLVIGYIKDFSKRKNFQLGTTSYNSYMDILIVDGLLDSGVAAISFYETADIGALESCVIIDNQIIVTRIRNIYSQIWGEAKPLKEGTELSDEDMDRIIKELTKKR